MIYIKKNREPRELRDYKRITPGASFDGMHGDIKSVLRKSLLDEQGYICAYCMKRIDDSTKIKIEHLQHRNSDNELDYNNLLAVCDGGMNNGDPNKFTCDTSKGNQEMEISPLNINHMATISYNQDGTIVSADYQHDLDDILNLNDECGYLIANRKVIINAMKKKLHKTLKPNQSAKSLLLKLHSEYSKKQMVNTKNMLVLFFGT